MFGNFKKNYRLKKSYWYIAFLLFIIYLILLTKFVLFKDHTLLDAIHQFSITFSRDQLERQNFKLFETISLFWYTTVLSNTVKFTNLGLNIIGFMPFSFLIPLLFPSKRNLLKMVIFTFFFSLNYELIQLFCHVGSFDVDDLFLNTLGGFLGYMAFLIVLLMIKRYRNYT